MIPRLDVKDDYDNDIMRSKDDSTLEKYHYLGTTQDWEQNRAGI